MLGKQYIQILTKLVSVTILGQIFSLLSTPLIARIYDPELIGFYGDSLAYVGIMATILNGRYDFAIIQAVGKWDKKKLILTTVLIGFSLSILALSTSQIFEKDFLEIIILIAFLLSQVSVINHFQNSQSNYNKLATNKLLNSITAPLLLILSGLLLQNRWMMLFCFLLGQLCILFYNREAYSGLINLKIGAALKTARIYYRFPKYLVPSTLSSELSGNLPIILSTSFFGIEYAGFLFMANRLISIPITFVGNSISEVYRQKAVEIFNEQGSCLTLFQSFFKVLCIIGLVSMASAYFLTDVVIEYFFGSTWNITARIIKIYSIMVCFQIISTPLAYSIILRNNQKFDLILQIFRLGITILSFLIGYHYHDFFMVIKIYVLGYVLYYMFHSYLQYLSVK